MKKIKHFYSTFVFAILILCIQASPARGQTSRIEDFIRAGSHDAEILTREYLKPLPNGLGGGLNSGWFNSASPHKFLGFDIQVRSALAFVPSSDRDFDIANLDLEKVRPSDPSDTITPTAAGDNSEGPEVVVEDNGDEVARFNLPQGAGYNFVPAPMIQASVGLIKSTDITVRYSPEIKIRKYGKLQIQGFGIKHSISQWLPAIFPLDITLMAGYNRINLSANLNLDPPEPDPTTNYDNQKVENSFNTFTTSLIVGKDLPFISVYGALGYETSTMNLDLKGNYPIQVSDEIGGVNVEHTETITDPFSYSENGINKFSLTGGLKFKLAFLHIFGEYKLAKYPIANAGVGISIR